jgi:hypothetical protein
MLRQMRDNESILIKDDPVRPRFTYEWRTSSGRQVWVWENPKSGIVDAVICAAYTQDIPTTEQELEHYADPKGNVIVFYTVWSYAYGAGRKIVNQLARTVQMTQPQIQRWVTLSPLTEMAERFHISNGAVLLQRGSECQNFEYTHVLQNYSSTLASIALRDSSTILR